MVCRYTQQQDFVLRNSDMEFDIQKLYKGSKKIFGSALRTIGVESFKKKVRGEPKQAYRIGNKKRFYNIVNQFE
ncbi:hypothetical protein ASN86_01674 [Streptococcus parauberis]|nr:hypothetical protein ASN86_01674 [Streptococcus parauberis]